jgi:cGMP-dependent protein kinase
MFNNSNDQYRGTNGQSPSSGQRRASEKTRPSLKTTFLDKGYTLPVVASENDFSRMSGEAVLANIPLFNRLTQDELRTVALFMDRKEFRKQKAIFSQGEPADAFYIIQSGECHVHRVDDVPIEVNQNVYLLKAVNFGTNHVPKGSYATVDKVDMTREYPYTIRAKATGVRGRVAAGEIALADSKPEPKLVATIKAGDFFGEQALVHGGPRGATVSAASDVILLRLTRERFLQNKLDTKLIFPRRKAVLPSHDDDDTDSALEKLPAPTTKDVDDIKRAIQRNSKLQVLNWTEETLSTVAASARLQSYEKGQMIIKRGDLMANQFYIVHSGEYTFSSVDGDCLDDKLSYLGKAEVGHSFGELALLYNAPRAVSVVCNRPGKLWTISRNKFKTVFKEALTARTNAYAQILQSVELLQPLTTSERMAVANGLVEITSLKGENIIKQGDNGDAFFILIHGTVEITKDGKSLNTLKADPKENKTHWFGERALLENEPRAATVQVKSDEAHVLALKRLDFERLLGPLEDILREAASNKRQSKLGLVYDESTRLMESPTKFKEDRSYQSMVFDDFRKVAVLGVGGFGAVHLVEHKPTKKVYALKALSKGYVTKMKMQKSVLREKEILQLCDSPFIVKMYRTFKNADTLFFLLEVFLGGELYHIYHRKRFHGSVSKARFYTASVICAFEFLHSRNVLYRDLKPENLLLDGQGFCKLTDMGLAKIVSGKTYTTCGTPDYFAPEVIQQTGQTKAVDWWTLGVLMHEMLSGHAPFTAESPMATYKKVIAGIGKVEIKYASNDPLGANLVVSLLKHNPGDRLPMRTGGLKNLVEHPWYRSFDWSAFRKGQVPPPYVPTVKGPLDASNFQATKTDTKPQTPYIDPKNGWDDTF